MGKGNKIALYTFILLMAFSFMVSCILILNSHFILATYKLPVHDITMLLLLLFPSTAAMAVPLGFFPAITTAYSMVEFGKGPLKEKMKYGMITAIVFTVIMILFNNYCVPAANLKYKQEYRKIAAIGYSKQAEDLKGLREMTFEELFFEYKKGNDSKQD
jgi:lipopolysaccharide export LptBFGC system permease protein LptF